MKKICLTMIAFIFLSSTAWGKMKLFSFSELFPSETPFTLQGSHGYKKLTFTIPEQWRIRKGSQLIVHLSHSTVLVPQRSTLNVFINGRAIGNIRLASQNASRAKVSFPIPISVLQNFNHLELVASQHYEYVECEDPFDPGLWTNIHETSSFLWIYDEKIPELNLARFPYPLFDPLYPDIVELNYALPTSPSAETLQSHFLLQSFMAREINWRPVDIRVVESERVVSPCFVIGTPEEQSLLVHLRKSLPGGLNLRMQGDKWVWIDPTGRTLERGKSILIFLRHPVSGTPVFVLSGNSPSDVLMGALLLCSPGRVLPSGTWTILQSSFREPTFQDPDGLLTNTHPKKITWGELGYTSQTVRGMEPPGVKVYFNVIPGTYFPISEQKLRLDFTYGPQVDADLSSLEVILNGNSIKGKALTNKDGEKFTLDTLLPKELLGNRNVIEIRFHLRPNRFNICVPQDTSSLWATVHDTSHLLLCRDWEIELPDLSLLRYWGYPFAVDAEGRGHPAFIYVGESKSTFMAYLQITYRLGVLYKGKKKMLTRPLSSFKEKEAEEAHLILVLEGEPPDQCKGLLAQSILLQETPKKSLYLKERARAKPNAEGYIEEMISPYNPRRAVLIFYGPRSEDLELAAEGFFQDNYLKQLQGAGAILSRYDEDVTIRTVPSVEQVRWGKKRWGTILKEFYSTHLLEIISTFSFVVLFLFFVALWLKRWLRKRKLRLGQ